MNLRNPKFGNVFAIDTGTIVRQTLGGETKTYRDPTWVAIENLTLEFEALTEVQKNGLVSFLAASASQQIFYTDYENQQWRGVVSSPIKMTEIESTCTWNVQFVFEGRRM